MGKGYASSLKIVPRTTATARPVAAAALGGAARSGLCVVLIVAAGIVIYPFIMMIFTSLKTQAEIATFPSNLFPLQATFQNYQRIWTRIPFGLFFRNSLIYATTVTLVSLLFDSMCAYALARLHFRGREVIFLIILATLMVPGQVTMIPLFINLFHLGWINTFQGLIIPHITSAFGIFLLRQFFLTIPVELEDAARIDGASELRIYAQIILPLSQTAIATLFIFHFMYNWNDFLWPLIMTTSQAMRTLPTGLALFMGDHNVEYGLLMAGSVISAAPLLIAFLFAQKYFIRGIAFTGSKE
jgi:multiple sugar transport system permease protein